MIQKKSLTILSRIIIIAFLFIVQNNAYGKDSELNSEIKNACNQVMRNIHEDILQIRARYEELKEYGNDNIHVDTQKWMFNGVSGIYYDYNYIPAKAVRYYPPPQGRLGKNGCRLTVGFEENEPLIYMQSKRIYEFENLGFYFVLTIQVENEALRNEIISIIRKNIQVIQEIEAQK
jgi:septum formation topological specificity factor MinE